MSKKSLRKALKKETALEKKSKRSRNQGSSDNAYFEAQNVWGKND